MAEHLSTAEEAADPATSPERLLELTERHPQLHRLLVSNPSTPEVARQWILATNPWAKKAFEAGGAEDAAASAEEPTRAAFAEVTEKSFVAARRRIATRAVMTAVVIFLIFAGVTGVLWIGARDVSHGTMTVGELVQFVIYAILVAGSVGGLSELWGELQRAAGATERLGELLATEDALRDAAAPVPLPRPVAGRIGFEAVTFHYPTRPDVSALEGVTMTIQPGETVALVGPSGSGKTTVVQLIQRFWDPQSGRVTIDGIDLPTTVDLGYDVTLTNWRFMHAPAGISEDEISQLLAIIEETIATPDWKESVRHYHWAENIVDRDEVQHYLDEQAKLIRSLYEELGV